MALTGTPSGPLQPLDVPTQFNLHQTSHAKKAPVKLPALGVTAPVPRVSGSKREGSGDLRHTQNDPLKTMRMSHSAAAQGESRDMVS